MPARTLGTISGRGKYKAILSGELGDVAPMGRVPVAWLLNRDHGSEVPGSCGPSESRICSLARPPIVGERS